MMYPTAGAIFDRFLHHVQVIAITGKSYCVKEAPVLNQEGKSTENQTNLRPQHRRDEGLAIRFCSFYGAANPLIETTKML